MDEAIVLDKIWSHISFTFRDFKVKRCHKVQLISLDSWNLFQHVTELKTYCKTFKNLARLFLG